MPRQPEPARAGKREAVPREPTGAGAPGGAPEARPGQNLMSPIMPATFVVSSLIVGAIDELAR